MKVNTFIFHYTWKEGTSWGTAPALLSTDHNNVVVQINMAPSQEQVPTLGPQGWTESELRTETPYLPSHIFVGDTFYKEGDHYVHVIK